MSRFGKTMAAIYGAGWEDRVDKGKMRQQYMANRKMFDSIAEKAIADANSGARRLIGDIPSVPNREVNIPTGKLSDLAIRFGATERIMDEQLRAANAIEDPEIKVSEIRTYTGNSPKRFTQIQETYSPVGNQYSRNDEMFQEKRTFSFLQQGGQVQDAQQKFISYIAEIFGIQNEAQLKQVVNKLGKQGIAQLQKAFQQGVPAEQIRQQIQGRTQSAKQGAKITRTGDFVPCAKCGGKAKKKRFADGGAIQSAGCGCSGVRKGCGGMTFSAKCGGKAKKVSKKENGGTVPETHGRPVGGATVLPFLMKNSNKKPKRFNAR